MSEFVTMGGYAIYVWGSYGAAVLVLTAIALLSWRRLRASKARLQTLQAAAPHRRRSRREEGVSHGAE